MKPGSNPAEAFGVLTAAESIPPGPLQSYGRRQVSNFHLTPSTLQHDEPAVGDSEGSFFQELGIVAAVAASRQDPVWECLRLRGPRHTTSSIV